MGIRKPLTFRRRIYNLDMNFVVKNSGRIESEVPSPSGTAVPPCGVEGQDKGIKIKGDNPFGLPHPKPLLGVEWEEKRLNDRSIWLLAVTGSHRVFAGEAFKLNNSTISEETAVI